MSVIVFASSKGGVGKTTGAMVFSTVLTRNNVPVTLIDGDPNQPIKTWAERFPESVPSNMKIVHAIGSDVAEAIDRADTPFTIVDLEGSRNAEVSVGIGRADLVLIPMRGSQLDADEAASIIRLIDKQKIIFRRPIPFRVYVSMASPVIEDRSARRILSTFRENDIPMLSCALMELAAFKLPFHTGKGIYDQVSKGKSPVRAISNAETFCKEVCDVLINLNEESKEYA